MREAAAQTLGGIVLPDQAKEKPSEGTVVSAGPGKLDPTTNVLIPMPVEAGSRVLYGKFDGAKVNYNGVEHTLIRDEDILLTYTGEELTLADCTTSSIILHGLLCALRHLDSRVAARLSC